MAKKRLQPSETLLDPMVTLPDPVDLVAPGALPSEGFVRGSSKAEVKSSSSMGMKLWLYSPARVVLLSEPTRKLAEVAQLRGFPNRKVERVEVVLDTTTRRIFFYPPDPTGADEDLQDAFEVTYRNDGLHAEFNIRSLLQPRGLEVERGWREKYDVKLEPTSECGPALVFQLTTTPVREKYKKGTKDVIEGEETQAAPKKATKRPAKAAATTAEAAKTATAQTESQKAAKPSSQAKGAAQETPKAEGSTPE